MVKAEEVEGLALGRGVLTFWRFCGMEGCCVFIDFYLIPARNALFK